MTIQNEARASYVGVGRRQIIEQTFWQIPWGRPIDPLAQTFMLTDERYITALDLFFVNKDPVADVTVQIRQVVNGYPSMNVLTSKVLKTEQVNLAQVTETTVTPVPTKITFPDPVLLAANTEYAIVVLTTSSQYRLYVARMATTDLVTKKQVARQPYDIGVLFSSSNGSAWTAHQDMDLKFRLYGARFHPSSTVVFHKITATSATHLILAANQLVPHRSEIRWEYSADGNTWFPLAGQDVTQLVKPADDIHIRATLLSTGSSPAVQNSLSAISMARKTNGVYISRQMTYREPFNRITIYVDLHAPTSTGHVFEYSVKKDEDGDDIWVRMADPTIVGVVDSQFQQVKVTQNLTDTAVTLRIRINQSSQEPMITPKARNLMVHTSYTATGV
ncbi:hypothetical protein [Brevibacillus dissolubilis]|uniref:hypothetical protein n=1 Tax=Brevibacillus dissolubilis TaxID=1844116 RepID=UPI0011169658|nr:hypothetical protein [Brevibacillus dissolubilis]